MPYWRLYYHMVWATHCRTPWLVGEAAMIAEAAIRQRLHALGGLVHAVAVMPDHVHVAASLPPTVELAAAIGQLKGVSSNLVRVRCPRLAEAGFGWQGEYGVLSFGEQVLPRVVAYVTNQEQHHGDASLIQALELVGDYSVDRSGRERVFPVPGHK